MYQLMVNSAAGDYYVTEWTQSELDNWSGAGYRTQEGHYNEYGLYDTKEELNKAISGFAGKNVYAVFYDGSAGDAFVSEENNLSGNWKGSKYSPYSFVKVFDNQEEAKKYARSLHK